MKKFYFVFIMFISIVLVSCTCGETLNSIFMSLNKTEFKINEPISLKITGELDRKVYKNANIKISFSKEINEEIKNDCLVIFRENNGRYLSFIGEGEYDFEFELNADCYEYINENIEFSMLEAGIYNVYIRFQVDRKYSSFGAYYGWCVYNFQFTVTE